MVAFVVIVFVVVVVVNVVNVLVVFVVIVFVRVRFVVTPTQSLRITFFNQNYIYTNIYLFIFLPLQIL